MTERIMIFGGGGQVGQALQHAPRPKDWDCLFVTRSICDIEDPAALRACVQHYNPTLLVNAAATSNVDQCEKDEDLAHRVNFHAAAGMAAQCSALDIPMIHLSTDYVFDGHTDQPYKENDAMNPINYYGASKMMGEEALRHELPFHVILRISSVFSEYKTNILVKALELIDTQEELRFVTDILSAPTPAKDVAQTIFTIAGMLINGKADGYGTFHYCGTPACSRYDFTKTVMESYAPYTDRNPTINKAKRADFDSLAQRPAYSLMDCSKIERIYGIKQPEWKPALQSSIAALKLQKTKDTEYEPN